MLDHPHLRSGARQCDADEATLFLRPDNTLDRVLAQGNVLVKASYAEQAEGSQTAEARSEQFDLIMAKEHAILQTAIFSGDVRAEVPGTQPMEGKAGRVVLEFSENHSSRKKDSGKNLLTKVHAEDHVKLLQHQNPASLSASTQDLELAASGIDFFLAKKQSRLDRAETTGTAQIAIRPAADGGPQTLITAAKFEAQFDDAGQLTSVHGAPDARIVSQNPGQPDRVSTSRILDATFEPSSGIQTVAQQGNVTYIDGTRKAWGDRARYTPNDQLLTLTGSARVTDGGMTTTANSMRLNRATGDAVAEGNVKTTYSDLKPQPNGALLSSSSPIHVTAHSMTVHGTSAIALYTGDARLWQDANIVEAQSIEFDRDHRSMIALGSDASKTVSTILVQASRSDKSPSEKPTLIAITSSRFTYADSDRKAHFEGDVVAKAADITITAKKMDAFLQARGPRNQPLSEAGKLEKIVAEDQVVITQPNRHAVGDLLIYVASDDKFVLSGGPPSIFDAEHGQITGVSLTFFRHDDRVLVEGNNLSPTVTQTRVAR
jgi:lipopolysaccharide export system protein LptA